ncbi:MAG: hypothetical protein IPM54_08545 [Polyangiaceae bacterium]|nr:hypothetical protein [Polyangiaceae bacterium]
MLGNLATRLGARFGLQPLPSWERELSQTLQRLSSERNTTFEDVATRAETDPAILRELTAAMTVGETYFLRDARQFHAALSHLVTHSDRPSLNVWSAGCSSGEEPYSLAILLARYAPQLVPHVHIRASDMNGESLERARRGLYGAWSFRLEPPWLRPDFFVPVGKNQWLLAPRIRSRVEFCEETIQAALARTASASVDVILFRNVSIYAQSDALKRIFDGFHRVLKGDGLLVESVSDARPPSELFDAVDGPVLGLFSPVDKTLPPPKKPSQRPSNALAREAPAISKSETPLLPGPREATTPANLLHAAIAYGDRGYLDRAFDCVERVLVSSPENADAHFVRGKLLMAARRSGDAVVELRQALFLSPRHRLARFWLATALVAIDMPRKAILELAELNRRLGHADPTELLEDGTTRVAELMTAVDTLQRTLQ